jgi:sarcosine oxidase subunit gamma
MVDPAIRITEAGDLHIWILRLPGSPQTVLKACAKALGAQPPGEPNRAVGREPRILWLAPGEWALVGRNGAATLGPAVARACEGALHHLADLHSGWSAFHIEGPGAADLIAGGCSLDLHPGVFGPNHCARTPMAQVPVLLERSPLVDGFTLYVDRSLAGHLRDWLSLALHGAAP